MPPRSPALSLRLERSFGNLRFLQPRHQLLRPARPPSPPLIHIPNPQSDPWRSQLRNMALAFIQQRSTRLSRTMWHPRSTRLQFRQTAPTSPHIHLGRSPQRRDPCCSGAMQAAFGRQHSDDCPGFYAQGAKLSGYQQHDDEESARIMSSNWTVLLICGSAVGKCTPVRSGGERAVIDELNNPDRPDIVHYVSGRCWVIIPEASQIIGRSWPVDAHPPLGQR